MSDKQQILIVIHHLTIGGVQKSLIAALNAIDYSQNNVTLYVRKNRLDMLTEINKNVKTKINSIKKHYHIYPTAIYMQLLIALCKLLYSRKLTDVQNNFNCWLRHQQMKDEKKKYFTDQKYDVVISYIQGYNAEFVVKYINATKKIVFYHGSTDEVHDLHERIFPSFDEIIAVNLAVKNILSALYPHVANKIFVIDNYVDYQQVRRKASEITIPKQPGVTTLCSCGRLSQVKGFDLAVDAAIILKNNKIPFTWYFVGDGPDRESLKKAIASKGLETHIIITGMLDNPYPYMTACDIYVQPSYEEAQPIAIIEAQILGKPVVTTKTCGGVSLVEDYVTGLHAEINAENVAKKIIELMDNKTLMQAIINKVTFNNYIIDREKYIKSWHLLLNTTA